MHKILKELSDYKTSYEKEDKDRNAIINLLIKNGHNCLYRDFFDPGHVTASALLMNQSCNKVLMNYHKFLKKWLVFGGHVDGSTDMLSAAMREAKEESGIENIIPLKDTIADIDIHPVPANVDKNEPAHFHHDISYFFRVDGAEDFKISDESIDLRWCNYEEAKILCAGNNMHRLLEKWKNLVS